MSFTYADPPMRTKPATQERSETATWALTAAYVVTLIFLGGLVRVCGNLSEDLKDNTAEQRKATAEQKAAADQAMQINGKWNEFFARTEREKTQ